MFYLIEKIPIDKIPTDLEENLKDPVTVLRETTILRKTLFPLICQRDPVKSEIFRLLNAINPDIAFVSYQRN
ncbi:hypothetical protein BpHYR1_024485 [Brachionus plicatilis]|uniref:Uncharacterized protein n=1 Tax=Brachionus plicatilis TaxID=10195 RepID=A0A3M7SF76_BRAPC|nr:hypothetical protein BpHYR1_024485 [Brachionus plicatilis]